MDIPQKAAAARRELAAGALAAAAVLGVFAYLKLSRPVYFDLDEYYHLAVALLVKKSWFPSGLEWFRFSMLGMLYADNTPLLHAVTALFLFPVRDAVLAGKLAALSMAGAFLGVSLFLYRRYAGGAAAAALLLSLLAAPSFVFSTICLRPATLALVFTMTGLYGMAERKKWVVFASCALFALAHISAFTMVFFALLCEALRRLRGEEVCRDIVAYALLGLLAGWLLHPNFPKNLITVYVNAVLTPFYVHADAAIPFAGELRPWTPGAVLYHNAPLFAAFVLSALAAALLRPAPSFAALFFAAAALVYTGLAFRMGRFWQLALPLGLLAAAAFWGDLVRSRRGSPDRSLRALACVWLLAAVCGVLFIGTRGIPARIERRAVPIAAVLEAALRIPSLVPPGETIFHGHWGDSELLVFASPGNRYINALDPMFMHYVQPITAGIYDALCYGHPGLDPYAVIRDIFRARYGFTQKTSPFYALIRDDRRFRTLYENESALVFKLAGP